MDIKVCRRFFLMAIVNQGRKKCLPNTKLRKLEFIYDGQKGNFKNLSIKMVVTHTECSRILYLIFFRQMIIITIYTILYAASGKNPFPLWTVFSANMLDLYIGGRYQNITYKAAGSKTKENMIRQKIIV